MMKVAVLLLAAIAACSASTPVAYPPCQGQTCVDNLDIMLVCDIANANTINFSAANCKLAGAQCCLGSRWQGLNGCSQTCDAQSIADWRTAHSFADASSADELTVSASASSPKNPTCEPSLCADPIFKVCNRASAPFNFARANCFEADAQCCLDSNYDGTSGCNALCNADTIAQWKAAHNIAGVDGVDFSSLAGTPTVYEPCTGSICADPIFKVCTTVGATTINFSNANCKLANALCCLDSSFQGLSGCNAVCNADTVVEWKAAHNIADASITNDLTVTATASGSSPKNPTCEPSLCADPIFKVCNRASAPFSFTRANCFQADAQCCLDSNYDGTSGCNALCNADTIAQWKAAHNIATGESIDTSVVAGTPTVYEPCTGSICADPIFKVCTTVGATSISFTNANCKLANALCCLDQSFQGLSGCNAVCNADTISQWKVAHNIAAGSSSSDYLNGASGSTGSGSSRSGVNQGALAGGIIGGIALVAVIGFFALRKPTSRSILAEEAHPYHQLGNDAEI